MKRLTIKDSGRGTQAHTTRIMRGLLISTLPAKVILVVSYVV